MKKTLMLITTAMALSQLAHSQYGYTFPTALYANSLESDLVDGVLDHSAFPGLGVNGWKPTYYVRGAVHYRTGLNPNWTAASVVNGATLPVGYPQGSRIIQGVGIRSDGGRWKPGHCPPPTSGRPGSSMPLNRSGTWI